MSDQHIDDDHISLVAALDDRDPERAVSDEHCARCSSCNARVTAARRELDALDALVPPALTQSDLERARLAVVDAIDFEQRPAPTARAEASSGMLEFALVAAAIVAPYVTGAVRASPPTSAQFASSIAALSWGVVAALGIARKRERRSFAALSIVAGATLIAVSDAFPQGNASMYKCALFELGAAVIPTTIAAVLIARRRRETLHLASVAAASALAASLTLRVSCPDRHLSHLLVTHVGGVVLAALFGAVVQRFVGNDKPTRRHT